MPSTAYILISTENAYAIVRPTSVAERLGCTSIVGEGLYYRIKPAGEGFGNVKSYV